MVGLAEQGFDDAPALLSRGREEASDGGEVGGAFGRAEAAGDFHPQLHHADVALGLVVAEGHGGIAQKAQRVASPGQEALQQIVSGSSRRAASGFATASGHGARQRRLPFMKGEARRDNRVVTSLDAGDEARLEGNAALAREVGGVAGSAQQSLHLARPVLFLDLDERLQLAKVMCVTQRVQHAGHRVVGLPVIVHDNAHDAREQGAALAARAIERQQNRAGDVQPLGFPRKVKKQKRPTDQSVRRLRLAVRSVARYNFSDGP